MNLWQREWRLLWRQGAAFIHGAAFLVSYTLALVFTQDIHHNGLQQHGAGLLYAGVVLSSLLCVDGIWRDEWRAQSFVPLLAQYSAASIVLVKSLSHALGGVLPLVLMVVPLALLLNISLDVIPHLVAALLLGVPALCLLCNTLAAAGLRGVFVSLIALPLLVPLFIFGAAAASASSSDTAQQAFTLLAAFDCVAMALCPLVGGMLLRDAMAHPAS